jgi:hypothetical protein
VDFQAKYGGYRRISKSCSKKTFVANGMFDEHNLHRSLQLETKT